MNGTSSRGPHAEASGSEVEVLGKPKRRRFSVAEKPRIVREADACAVDAVGAYLRREAIYSSQLYPWRRERDRGDLDYPQAKTRRDKKRLEQHDLQRRNNLLEMENRKLQRKVARLELFEDIRKKQRGSCTPGSRAPSSTRTTDRCRRGDQRVNIRARDV